MISQHFKNIPKQDMKDLHSINVTFLFPLPSVNHKVIWKVRMEGKIMNLAQKVQSKREFLYWMFIAAHVLAKSQSMGQLQRTGNSHYSIKMDSQESLTSNQSPHRNKFYNIADFDTIQYGLYWWSDADRLW